MPEIFVGQLKGEKVFFPRIDIERIEYRKRPRSDYQILRVEFAKSERARFLRYLSNDQQKVSVLKRVGLSHTDLHLLRLGKVPDGWQVHHKLPLDDNGTNDFRNLILIKNDPYHIAITNEQSRLVSNLKVGEMRVVRFPIPKGFIYGPNLKERLFSELIHKASYALRTIPLLQIANNTELPEEARNKAIEDGWGRKAAHSLEALLRIRVKYGETKYEDLIKAESPAFYDLTCFCDCHRTRNADSCECCSTYSSFCGCYCHFCETCDDSPTYCGDSPCYCNCHDDWECCDDCAGSCWCQCHNCTDCYDPSYPCGGEEECGCVCHESCDDCSGRHEGDDDEEDSDEDTDDDDDDDSDEDGEDEDDDDNYNLVSQRQRPAGPITAKLLFQKVPMGEFRYKREGDGFRCLSISWKGMAMGSVMLTNKDGASEVVYSGGYFTLDLRGGGVHNLQ